MCKEIIPILLCVALLLSFTLPEIGDYTIKELVYGVQDTITVVRGTRIVCEIIAVSNPGYVVYTIYATDDYRTRNIHARVSVSNPVYVVRISMIGLRLSNLTSRRRLYIISAALRG